MTSHWKVVEQDFSVLLFHLSFSDLALSGVKGLNTIKEPYNFIATFLPLQTFLLQTLLLPLASRFFIKIEIR